MKTKVRFIISIGIFLCSSMSQAQQTAQKENLKQQAAAHFLLPTKTMILGATLAGTRIVAVGDRGVILLSDDEGKTYRQAKQVPTRATLTGVTFIDAKQGWAAGHWGVVLHTADGGETWGLQRDDISVDQPLHTIWFKDKNHGIAAGLFSLLLVTEDGGKSWKSTSLPAASGGKRSDLNLFRLFPDRLGNVLIVGEQGSVYRSADNGKTWELLATGNKGTLWTGIVLLDNSILVGGISGRILRSIDNGKSWIAVASGTKSSITDFIELANGQVLGVGLDGYSVMSNNHGEVFTAQQREDQLPLTSAVANSKGLPLIFSQNGIVTTK